MEHGSAGLYNQLMTSNRGSSNAKAKQTLGWTPAHPSWRTGFVSALGERALNPR